MNAETLRCAVCQREVRIVRLGHSTLALGHTQNPRNGRHPVQLARDGQDTRGARGAVAPAHREGPDVVGQHQQRGAAALSRLVSSRHGPSPRSVARPSTGRTPSAGVGHDRAPRPALSGARVDGGTPPASSRSAERSTLT